MCCRTPATHTIRSAMHPLRRRCVQALKGLWCHHIGNNGNDKPFATQLCTRCQRVLGEHDPHASIFNHLERGTKCSVSQHVLGCGVKESLKEAWGGYSIVPRLIGLPSTPVETTNDAGVAPPGEPCLAFCCTHTRADTTLGGVRALEDSLTVVVVLFGTMYTHSTQMFGESG